MGALLGGAGAAVAWAVASVCAARSSREIGARAALAGVMGAGMLLLLPLLALSDRPSPSAATTGWLVVSGAANLGGLLLAYRALQAGPVGVVASIVAAQGGVTAVIAVLFGASLAAVEVVALTAVLGGVAMVAWKDEGAVDVGRAALLASAAALVFGVGLYATGRAADDVPIAWAVAPSRVLGVAVLVLPLLVRGRLRVPRAILPYLAAGGALEVAGFLSFTAGAGVDIPVTAVLASLTGAVAAGLGRVFYGERLTRRQVAGVAVLVVAVAVLGAIT